jgi:hypothetical protein
VAEEEMSDNKILPYCSIDKKADKRSLGELEQDFLEALQVKSLFSIILIVVSSLPC